MKIRRLPGSELLVSEVCLGTMMFGEQVNKKNSFAQLDLATKQLGINFIDTAESYPFPSCPSTAGRTESMIGEWLNKKGSTKRNELVISSKVCGFSDELTWLRKDGKGTRVTKAQIEEAVDAQLRRLGTDYIDL
jgi:aryl-alcohol dehydrogenase-like predicted oxidoreductase